MNVLIVAQICEVCLSLLSAKLNEVWFFCLVFPYWYGKIDQALSTLFFVQPSILWLLFGTIISLASKKMNGVFLARSQTFLLTRWESKTIKEVV